MVGGVEYNPQSSKAKGCTSATQRSLLSPVLRDQHKGRPRRVLLGTADTRTGSFLVVGIVRQHPGPCLSTHGLYLLDARSTPRTPAGRPQNYLQTFQAVSWRQIPSVYHPRRQSYWSPGDGELAPPRGCQWYQQETPCMLSENTPGSVLTGIS